MTTISKYLLNNGAHFFFYSTEPNDMKEKQQTYKRALFRRHVKHYRLTAAPLFFRQMYLQLFRLSFFTFPSWDFIGCPL